MSVTQKNQRDVSTSNGELKENTVQAHFQKDSTEEQTPSLTKLASNFCRSPLLVCIFLSKYSVHGVCRGCSPEVTCEERKVD